jgi:hypothetical protein
LLPAGPSFIAAGGLKPFENDFTPPASGKYSHTRVPYGIASIAFKTMSAEKCLSQNAFQSRSVLPFLYVFIDCLNEFAVYAANPFRH